MLVWQKETNQEVLFENRIDAAKVTFMLKEGTAIILEEMKLLLHLVLGAPAPSSQRANPTSFSLYLNGICGDKM